jgi:hypothetical protein
MVGPCPDVGDTFKPSENFLCCRFAKFPLSTSPFKGPRPHPFCATDSDFLPSAYHHSGIISGVDEFYHIISQLMIFAFEIASGFRPSHD